MTVNVIFDADDTLWAVEELYDQARTKVAILIANKRWGNIGEIEERAKEIDKANYKELKVKRERFPKSMADTYREFASRKKIDVDHIDDPALRAQVNQEIEQARKFGDEVFETKAINYDDTKATLNTLKSAGCRLFIWTQGDEDVQKKRLAESGLEGFFEKVAITDDKSEHALRAQLVEWDLDAKDTWLIGNSSSSDIQPAIQAGLRAIWVPAYSWRPSEPPKNFKDGTVFVLDALERVPEIILPVENREKIKKQTEQGQFAYLFVSAYHDLYRQYVMDILAYPRGYIFKFPYDVTWLPLPYRHEPEKFCEQVVDKPALVVFSDERAEGAPRRVQNFIPIRFARITQKPRVEGGTVHIQFVLEDYVGYSAENSAFDFDKAIERVRSYNKSIWEQIEARPRWQRKASAYFSLGPELDWMPKANAVNQEQRTDKHDDDSWKSTINILSDLRRYFPTAQEKDSAGNPPARSMMDYPNPFHNAMFFRVQFLLKISQSLRERIAAGFARQREQESQLPQKFAVPLRVTEYGDSGYVLQSSENYRLSLLFGVAERPPAIVRRSKIVANLTKDLLSGIGSTEIPLNFRYDIRNIDFITARVYEDVWASIALTVVTPDAEKLPEGEQVVSPLPVFLVKLSASRVAQIVAPLIFMASAALASLNAVLAKALVGNFPNLNEATLAVLFGLVGSIGTTASLYYLYRKLR